MVLQGSTRQVGSVGQRAHDGHELRSVDIEDASGFRLITGRDIVAGQRAEARDAVHLSPDHVRLNRESILVTTHDLHDRLESELLHGDGHGHVAGVGVGGGVIRDVDRVDVRLEPIDGFGHRVEITTVHRRELRGHDRSFAGSHQFVEGTHYSDPFHPVGVWRSAPLTRFIQDESPARELFTGARRCPISSRHDCGSSGRFSARWFAFTHTHCISGLTSQAPSTATPPQGPLRRVFGHVIGQVIPVSCSTH